MKKQFQNYFHDWSNLLSFALALIPAWLMYKYPPRVKVPFYAIVLIILIALLSVWLNIKQWLDIRQLLEDQQRLVAKKRQASRFKTRIPPSKAKVNGKSLLNKRKSIDKIETTNYTVCITNKAR